MGLFGCCEGSYWQVKSIDDGLGNQMIADCKATLIVCPTPILDQWRSEIERHTEPGSIRLSIYTGVKGGGAMGVRELCECDVVLTTYDALRADVHHDGSAPRLLRGEKTYAVETSPLLLVSSQTRFDILPTSRQHAKILFALVLYFRA